jgi:hypothetical protein
LAINVSEADETNVGTIVRYMNDIVSEAYIAVKQIANPQKQLTNIIPSVVKSTEMGVWCVPELDSHDVER